MTKPYPKEFRDNVVRVARNRGPDVDLEQIAKDFGIRFTTLYSWLKKADVEDGRRVRSTSESVELYAARRRIKTLEQEVEVLRRAFRSGQFRSRKLQQALFRHRMLGSMGQVGAPGDNAAMESFFSLLQKNVLNCRI